MEEYVQRHPDLTDEIRAVFPALVMIEQIASASADLNQSKGTAEPSGHIPFDHVGDYRIIREVGRGGMGVVYEAEQESRRPESPPPSDDRGCQIAGTI